MTVTYPTTPANYFHLLRRQALRKIIKPLIVMTPKGLLRDARATSPLNELTHGAFQEILPDPTPIKNAQRVILCSGKVFYDLADYREKHQIRDTAILRLEQLYPLHEKKLLSLLALQSPHAELVWCQEESENMGAWSHLALRLQDLTKRKVRYAGRDASSSPATGSLAIHLLEQDLLVREAFAAPSPTQTPAPALKKTSPLRPKTSKTKTGKKLP
jgi:2-oxoglutarate dehydrogenase E1 component